jgi:hypothetical protein
VAPLASVLRYKSRQQQRVGPVTHTDLATVASYRHTHGSRAGYNDERDCKG